MGYFRELPDLDYQSFLSSRTSNDEYLRVKNLFRRNKLRDDLANTFTLFNKYEIVEGARPDTVAEEMYGSAELDWVVLLTAGITNVRDHGHFQIEIYITILLKNMVLKILTILTITKRMKLEILQID